MYRIMRPYEDNVMKTFHIQPLKSEVWPSKLILGKP